MKEYIAPSTDVITIMAQQILAGSAYGQNIEEGFGMNELEETNAVSGNLARRRNLWDDDMEDEEF